MANDRWRDDDRQAWNEDRWSQTDRTGYGDRGRDRLQGAGSAADAHRNYDRSQRDDGPGFGEPRSFTYGSDRDRGYGGYGGDNRQGYASRGQGPQAYRGGYADYGQGYAGYEQGYAGYGRGQEADRYHGRAAEDWRGGEERDWWDRTKDQVRAWSGDDEARRRRERDERLHNRGRGPRGYTRSDERIREDVSDRLSDDWRVDASDIEVKVEAGEVTLSGKVVSRDDKRRAEDLAESCSGVKHVQNNLRVRDRGANSNHQSADYGTATTSPEVVRDITDG
jgi:osmotically-inducible protein OsmY